MPVPQANRPAPRSAAAPGGVRYLSKDFFVFEFDFMAIAAGASPIVTKTITETDFQLEKLTYFAEIAGGAQTSSTQVVPLVNVTIAETNGRPLMDAAVPVPALFGTGQVPFILPVKKIYERQSIIQIQAFNVSAATTYNLHLALIGEKLYRG